MPLAVVGCMFKYDPNHLSRSERRHQTRMGARPVIQDSQGPNAPTPAVPTPYSVRDTMMFSMDPSRRQQTFDLAASPLAALATPRRSSGTPQEPAAVNYLGHQRQPTFFPRTRENIAQPQKRVVGFCISDSEGSGSERSSSDSLDCDIGRSYSESID